ncbi:hydroxymethylbilane synthase [Nonomuraea sediminis]|uniref:hydroxymethylbilane synthase n=1 Tax=Nonomuraea sediminis TaxID=2835864 RepID=UPI001BDC6BAC|nr:hydroxymethylbilane synthase [Nonomuraea sediminis]
MRLGTRESKLALAQSRWVAARLPVQAELVGITTDGDRSSEPIERIGTTGVFVTALRLALLAGEVDFVVHSFKDLPTAPLPGVRLAAVPERADPRDALVGREVRAGCRVGTGSQRRAVQIRRMADVEVVPIRGNVDTRLRKLQEGGVDALVLAKAGLDRLGLRGRPLDPRVMLPAPAQGALAVECRQDDERTAELLATLDHPPTRVTVTAERALLTALNAGCTAPVGALARLDGPGTLRLDGLVARGDLVVRKSVSGPVARAAELGAELAEVLW